MNKKKSIMGAGIITALAGIALVSCGKDKTKSYTITLDANDSAASLGTETDAYTVKTAQELLDALKNVTPTKEGYTFKGWFLDTEAKNQVTADTDLSTIVEEGGIRYIYAGFEINEYTVTFDTKGVAATAGKVAQATVGVDYNNKVSTAPNPSEPAKDANGHELTFTGWYASAADAATNDATKKVTPTDIAITKDTTFYAGWTITEISTVDQFVEYVNAKEQKTNAYLSADLTFTNTLDRMSTNTAIAVLISDGNLVNSFSAKFYGDDHKITNLKIESDLKCAGIWGKLSGTVQDITFVNASLTTAGQNAGILTGTVENGATITDVDFDSATVESTASNGYASIVAGQAKEADGVVNFDGITIKNSTLTGTKYNGGILATIVQTNMKVNFTDCVVELNLTASDESNGLVFGYANSGKSTGSVVSFDGVVASGTVEAKKNVGALVGNNKDANTTINIKNSAVINYTANTKGTATQVNTFVGQNNGTLNFDKDTCYYQEYHANTNINGSASKDTVKQGTPVSLETLSTKELSKNITFAYDASTVTLTVKGDELAITAKDPDVVDLSDKTATVTSNTGAANLVPDTKTSYYLQGTAPYYEGVISGQAGNGAIIKITAPSDVTDFDGINYSGLLNAKFDAATKTISGYLMLSETAAEGAQSEKEQLATADVTKTVSVQWFNNGVEVATPVQYSLIFRCGFLTLGNNPVGDGQISLDASDATHNDTTVLTAAADGLSKLNVTAGQIDFDQDGNYVYVKVARPTTLPSSVTTTTETVKLTGATMVTAVDGTDGYVIAKVQIKAKGNTTFGVQWSSSYDADMYTINVADAVVLEVGNVQYDESIDFSKISTLDQATVGSFFTLKGSPSLKSDKASAEFRTGKGVEFTIQGTGRVTVTITCKSTGPTNYSLITLTKGNTAVTATSAKLDDADAASANGVYNVYTEKTTTITYTLEAGTYFLQGAAGVPAGTTGDSVTRPVRVMTISVKSVAEKA